MANAVKVSKKPRFKVGFLHVGENSTEAEIMVASVKMLMDVEVVQMTDKKTKAVEGVDDTIRIDWDGDRLMTYRMLHLKEFPEDAIFLDTDTVVLMCLESMFDEDFDVALTKREEPILWNGQNITPLMPYNTGVMFSKSREFWARAYEHCKSLPEEFQKWWGDQLAVHKTSREFDVLELECDEYNYTPKQEKENLRERAVVHYKGPRKGWMINEHKHILGIKNSDSELATQGGFDRLRSGLYSSGGVKIESRTPPKVHGSKGNRNANRRVHTASDGLSGDAQSPNKY